MKVFKTGDVVEFAEDAIIYEPQLDARFTVVAGAYLVKYVSIGRDGRALYDLVDASGKLSICWDSEIQTAEVVK